MRIQEIFEKDIHRSINGVVKVDQTDESVTWQELEEYVITRELGEHIKTFFDAYVNALDKGHDPNIASQIGIWISGFFGSGKSHFLKILSYLMENRVVDHKAAIDHFDAKIEDEMTYSS